MTKEPYGLLKAMMEAQETTKGNKFCLCGHVAEGEGFEPPTLAGNSFQDCRHSPLGHPSRMSLVYWVRTLLARA